MDLTRNAEHALPNWRDELARQGRTIRWLALRTSRTPRALYSYSAGDRPTPDEFLVDASIALGVKVGRDPEPREAA